MDLDLTQISLVPLTAALVEMIKKMDPDKDFERIYPVLAEAIGMVLGLLSGIAIIPSLAIGLAAMGLYSGVIKTTIRGE